jgi:hypothetical protein
MHRSEAELKRVTEERDHAGRVNDRDVLLKTFSINRNAAASIGGQRTERELRRLGLFYYVGARIAP